MKLNPENGNFVKTGSIRMRELYKQLNSLKIEHYKSE